MSIQRANDPPLIELHDDDDSDIIIVDVTRNENRVLDVITLDDEKEEPVKKAEPEVITLEDDDDEVPPTPRAAGYPLPSPSVSIPIADSSANTTPRPTSDIADLASLSPEGTPAAVQATPKSRRQAAPRARASPAPKSVAPTEGSSIRGTRSRRTQVLAPEAEDIPDAEAEASIGSTRSTRRTRREASPLQNGPSTSEATGIATRARGAREEATTSNEAEQPKKRCLRNRKKN